MRSSPRRHLLAAVGLLAVIPGLALAACGGPASSAAGGGASGNTVTVGLLAPNAAAGFLSMAEAKGFFANYGVKVRVKTLQSADQLTPALISGAAAIIEESPGAAMVAMQKGVLKAKVIGSSMPGLPWMIVAKHSITSLAQLKGHSMGVSSATGLPQVVANLILQKHGVSPSSVKFVNTAANAQRFEEVVTGSVDSASVPSDFIPQAKAKGLNVLALSAEEIPQYPRFAIIARSDFLQAHPKLAVGYLAGVMQGERYAFDHPAEAKQLAAQALGGNTTASSPAVLDMYNQIVKDKLVNRNATIPMSMLQYLQQTLLSSGLISKPLNLSTVYDDQYRQQALALVNKKYPS